ncbi:MAG: helix-turn-helix domain-containing protein [Acidimicrobiia bacterium]
MDFRRPVEAVIPGVQGRILAVLAETTAELNLRTIARLADVSPAQASRVLPELVVLGLVERREAPPSALFALVEDHVAARIVRALSRSREAVLEELGKLAGKVDPGPVSAVVFGSFSRGEADATSDLDVVIVRPAGIGEDDEPWVSSVEAWRAAARRLTGNSVQVLEIDESEVVCRLRRPTSLWADVIRDGVTVYGSPLGTPRST